MLDICVNEKSSSIAPHFLQLPYSCCFCCRSSTPCIVWAFVGISLVFFKMGAIVTGRWIYLSSTSFDEIVFYITFTICLGESHFCANLIRMPNSCGELKMFSKNLSFESFSICHILFPSWDKISQPV